MDNWFMQLVTNPFLLTGLAAWFLAQVVKLFLDAAINRKFDFLRLIGDGGMPSAHSATVCALATLVGTRVGVGGWEFAMAVIFAIVVCRDAVGVRRETGKQAVILQEIVETLEDITKEELPEVRLKKLVGHTVPQVIAGIALGIVTAGLMNVILP